MFGTPALNFSGPDPRLGLFFQIRGLRVMFLVQLGSCLLEKNRGFLTSRVKQVPALENGSYCHVGAVTAAAPPNQRQ